MTYRIDRFWRTNRNSHPLGEGGFLKSPVFEVGGAEHRYDDSYVRTQELASRRCLVLLGPPGSGKTTELGRLAEELGGGSSLRVALGEIADYAHLKDELFDQPAFRVWIAGQQDLTIILDSLDEGRLSIPTIAATLRGQLRGPFGRLRLWITCRSADWSEPFESFLGERFGKSEMQTYSLAPLRMSDALEWARARLGDAAPAFMSEVASVKVGALASNPITLRLLLGLFAAGGKLPQSTARVYEEGCKLLCRENSADRRDAGRTGAVSEDDRYELATRICGLIRLTGRAGIAMGPGSEAERENWIVPSDLEEPSSARDALLGDHVSDLLSHSALFERAGGERYRISHAALGDYLAARFIRRTGTPAERALRILSHPKGGLTPQHRETASYLAALDPAYFDALTEAGEARWALRYVETLEQSQCERVLHGLLAEAKLGLVSIWTLDYASLRKLSGTSAESLVREVLLSESRHEDERRLAADLARELELRSLVPDLLSVALSEPAPPRLRASAIYEVGRLGKAEDRKALLPLASQPRAADPERYVAYAARRVLLPDLLSVERATQLAREDAAADVRATDEGAAHPPRANSSRMGGAVHTWPLKDLVRRSVPGMGDEVLGRELYRLALLPSFDAYDGAAAQEVGKEAYTRLDRAPALACALARLVVGVDRRLFSLDIDRRSRFDGASLEDDDRRRPLIAALVTHLASKSFVSGSETADSAEQRLGLMRYDWNESLLFRTDDTAWYIDQLLEAESEPEKDLWGVLLRDRAYPHPGEQETWEIILSACLAHGSETRLAAIYHRWFAAVELGSAREEAERLDWNERLEREARGHTRRAERAIPHDPPLLIQLASTLESTRDALDRWPEVLELLTYDPQGLHVHTSDCWSLDFERYALWRTLADEHKDTIVDLALNFLRAWRSAETELFEQEDESGKRSMDRRALAALNATVLVSGREGALESLGAETARHLAVALLDYGIGRGDSVTPACGRLVDLSLSANEDAFWALVGRAALVVLDPIRILRGLSCSVPEAVAQAFASRSYPNDDYRDNVIDQLIEMGSQHACDLFARQIEELRTSTLGDKSEHWRLVRRAALTTHLPFERVWSVLSERFVSDDIFANRWLRTLASEVRSGLPWPDASAQAVGQMYRRLHELHPLEFDPAHVSGASYSPSAADRIADLRGALLRALAFQGSDEDIGELLSLQRDLPGVDLRWWIARAREQRCELNPHFLLPAGVVLALRDPLHGPLRSDEDLLALTTAALDHVQRSLSAQEQPAAHLLWDASGRPRGENVLSDWLIGELRRLLEVRGVSLTRETESDRSNRLDFRLEVPPDLSGGRREPLLIYVEAKGTWNRDIPGSMSAQLANRYLRGAGRSCGIYLVYDFNLAGWAEQRPDGRRDRGRERAALLHSSGVLERLEELACEIDGQEIRAVTLKIPPSRLHRPSGSAPRLSR